MFDIVEHMFDTVVMASEPTVPEFLWSHEAEQRLYEEIEEITHLLEDDADAWWAAAADSPPGGCSKRVRTTWACVEIGDVPGLDKVSVLRGLAQMVARGQAQMYDLIASIVDEYELLDEDMADAHAGAAAELQAALRSTRRTAESDVLLAWQLRDGVPPVLDALRTGQIDLARAKVIVHETIHLESAARDRVVERVLPDAPTLTTGQLRALIRRLCIELDPASAVARREGARVERSVSAELSSDGTATITAIGLEPDRTAVAMDRIDRIARSLRESDETRTIDQLRADVFLDLLEGANAYRQAGTLEIRVDLETLVGMEERSADLGGFGPVVADIARQMTERFGASWQVGVLDSAGDLVHTGLTRRRPDSATRRHVEMRDRTCVFPGCRTPAKNSDLDHRTPHAEGGSTHAYQLVPLCRHHHRLRHTFNWTHVRNTDGSHTWYSPLGTNFTRPPPA